MSNSDKVNISRRRFVGSSALFSGLIGVVPQSLRAEKAEPADATRSAIPATPPIEQELAEPSHLPAIEFERAGSDFMVDVIKGLDVKYVAANPGSTFRGLHESIINYGGNEAPELLTCCHEESSVALAHGYFKITGKPMMAMVQGTVGLQHASMAIYNAYADRVPILLITASHGDANTRRPWIEWSHSVIDDVATVRDFTKWDDTPRSLQHFAESQVRAMKIAMAVPSGPVILSVDGELQEEELSPGHEAHLTIPSLTLDRFPEGNDAAVEEAAALLLAAEAPVIVADRYRRTPDGLDLLVELAELLQAPVLDTADRCNFPSHHPLNLSDDRGSILAEADVLLALEVADLWSYSHSMQDIPGRPWVETGGESRKTITIGTAGTVVKSNYQDFQRYSEADLSISGDAETTLPALIENIKRGLTASRTQAFATRGNKLADRSRAHAEARRARVASVWDLAPVSLERLITELHEQIKNDDWSLVGFPNRIAPRLMPMEKYYHHTGGTGAGGIGYGASAAVGSALANRDAGRLSVTIQPDGDLMYAPGILWTAAHHQIPLLFVMFNNRAYHQETMHLQRVSARMQRGVSTFRIGTTLDNPFIDYAKMASSMGLYSEGPISEPQSLREALMRALAVVRRGEPALVDVVTQPR